MNSAVFALSITLCVLPQAAPPPPPPPPHPTLSRTRGAHSAVTAPVRSYPAIKSSFIRSVLPGQRSTAKTCFVLFNLFHRGRKPTVTLSFASDAVRLPCGPNVRLYCAVLVIHPKYSSSRYQGLSQEIRGFTYLAFRGARDTVTNLRCCRYEINSKFITISVISLSDSDESQNLT